MKRQALQIIVLLVLSLVVFYCARPSMAADPTGKPESGNDKCRIAAIITYERFCAVDEKTKPDYMITPLVFGEYSKNLQVARDTGEIVDRGDNLENSPPITLHKVVVLKTGETVGLDMAVLKKQKPDARCDLLILGIGEKEISGMGFSSIPHVIQANKRSVELKWMKSENVPSVLLIKNANAFNVKIMVTEMDSFTSSDWFYSVGYGIFYMAGYWELRWLELFGLDE